ncbi:MAG: structural protein P5 [Dysgonomonas sp.]
MARGLRNNNPLNIRHNSDTFVGEVPGNDKAFKSFKDMAHGYRAAFVTLHTYLVKYRRDTIEKIIKAWAPPEDNNDTEAYIVAVEKQSGVARDKALTDKSGSDYIKIVGAMSKVENGKPAVMSEVESGFKLQWKITK